MLSWHSRIVCHAPASFLDGFPRVWPDKSYRGSSCPLRSHRGRTLPYIFLNVVACIRFLHCRSCHCIYQQPGRSANCGVGRPFCSISRRNLRPSACNLAIVKLISQERTYNVPTLGVCAACRGAGRKSGLANTDGPAWNGGMGKFWCAPTVFA